MVKIEKFPKSHNLFSPRRFTTILRRSNRSFTLISVTRNALRTYAESFKIQTFVRRRWRCSVSGWRSYACCVIMKADSTRGLTFSTFGNDAVDTRTRTPYELCAKAVNKGKSEKTVFREIRCSYYTQPPVCRPVMFAVAAVSVSATRRDATRGACLVFARVPFHRHRPSRKPPLFATASPSVSTVSLMIL